MYTPNLWSIVLSAVAGMVIGAIWYGPLFGKRYMAAVGMDAWPQDKKDAMKRAMFKSYALQFIASLLMYWVLAEQIGYNGLTAFSGMVYAFFIWLGFMLPVEFGKTLWGGSKSLFWMSIGSELLSLLAAGAIIGALR